VTTHQTDCGNIRWLFIRAEATEAGC